MIKSNNSSDENNETLSDKEIRESKAKYRKVVQAAIATWVKDFQAGRIKIETVDDLRKLIEMDLELQRDEF